MASLDPDAGTAQADQPEHGVEPRIKGIAMKATIEALMEEEETSRKEVPDGLQHYFREPILVSSWYPERDHQILLGVVAKVFHRPGKDVWFWMGQSTAQRDLKSLYKAMVQVGQPITTLKRIPKIWRLYRDSGYVKVQTIGSSKGLVRIYDYPLVSPEFTRTMTGFLSEAIVISGGKRVVVNPTSGGQKIGAPAIWAVSWSS